MRPKMPYEAVLALLCLLLLGGAPSPASGQTLRIAPGEVRNATLEVLGCSSETGDHNPALDPNCAVYSLTGRQVIQVRADAMGAGFAGENYEGNTGALVKPIRIEGTPTCDPEVASCLVKVGFAAEFFYEGILTATTSGISPVARSQIVVNFKVFDSRDGTLGEVVGSRIVLDEDNDVDFSAADPPFWKFVQGSAAMDFAVDLERGQNYFIVAEATCHAEVAGGGQAFVPGVDCDFMTTTRGNELGVRVSPVIVTVRDDALERTADDLARIERTVDNAIDFLVSLQDRVTGLEGSVNAIRGDTTALLVSTSAIQTDTSAIRTDTSAIRTDTSSLLADTARILAELRTALADLDAIQGQLDTVEDKLMDFRTAFDSATADATAERQALSDLSKEIIRLLHVPTGLRTSEVPACVGEGCDFPER